MMDPRSRPLPLRPAAANPGASGNLQRPAAAVASAPEYPLTDLPVEAPLDPPPPSEPRPGGRAGTIPGAAAARPAEGAADELVDPEKLLLASEHAQRPAAAAPQGATPPPAVPATDAGTGAPSAPRAPELMDRDFIERNQVIERYLSGRLPIKGATDFERFCRDHPQLLDELGIPERVNAALRLLEAGGKPEPWAEPPKPFWQKLEVVLGLLGTILVLAIALALIAGGSIHKSRRIAALRREAIERPLKPAASTRDIQLLPSREGASNTPAILIGGGREGQLADFHIDESRSPYRLFRIVIDRIDQGRVGIIDRLAKDSNGDLGIALNTTALGPGDYQLTIEGLNWQGQPQPDSWVTIGIRAAQ